MLQAGLIPLILQPAMGGMSEKCTLRGLPPPQKQ